MSDNEVPRAVYFFMMSIIGIVPFFAFIDLESYKPKTQKIVVIAVLSWAAMWLTPVLFHIWIGGVL